MIQDYQKKQFIEKISENCSLFKALKAKKPFFMYEYPAMDMSDQYHFKILKKLITSTHVLGVIQKFQANNATYFITDYLDSNLLKQQLKQPHQIFQMGNALAIFANLVQVIEELHQQNIIYRNLRLETVGFDKDKLFLTDFRFSQVVKRRQRYFEMAGVSNYMAPEFYLEDGYGYEVDIWAAAVCLYFMITGIYPFNLEDKSEEQMLKEIQAKCKKGFSFVENASKSKKAKYIQSSQYLDELFMRLFQLDYSKRITIQQLKAHPALKEYFKEGPNINLGQEMMSVIEEEKYSQQSIFMSMLSGFQSHHEFHKEEIVLDFMEHSSQILVLNSPESIGDQLKTLVSFSILKVAVFKVNNLIKILSGQKEPEFKVEPTQWEEMKKTTGFKKVKQKLQKKKKILEMLFRAAFLNVQNFKKSQGFYSNQIVEDFGAVKQDYRLNLSKMFEVEKEIMKKEKKENARKTCENLARLTILCMINRVFQEQNLKETFRWYYEWSRKQSLQRLEEWIQNQKMSNLKNFIKHVTTTKYAE